MELPPGRSGDEELDRPLVKPSETGAAGSAAGVEACVGINLSAELSRARSIARKEALARAEVQKERAALAERFDKEVGAKIKEEVMARVPALQPWEKSLKAQPHHRLQLLDLVEETEQPAVLSALWAASHKQQSNLHNALLDDWRHKNRLLLERSPIQEEEGEQEAADTDSRCLQQGFCTCEGRGKEVGRFRVQLHKALKSVFPARGDLHLRQLLRDGMIVIHLLCTQTEAADIDPWPLEREFEERPDTGLSSEDLGSCGFAISETLQNYIPGIAAGRRASASESETSDRVGAAGQAVIEWLGSTFSLSWCQLLSHKHH